MRASDRDSLIITTSQNGKYLYHTKLRKSKHLMKDCALDLRWWGNHTAPNGDSIVCHHMGFKMICISHSVTKIKRDICQICFEQVHIGIWLREKVEVSS